MAKIQCCYGAKRWVDLSLCGEN